MLTTYTVNSLNDTAPDTVGDTTLREALVAAFNNPGADTIDFAPSLTASGPVTITLSHDGSDGDTFPDKLLIDSNVTIEGPGANLLTISGNNQTRVFEIPTGIAATIRGVTVSQGATGVYNSGNLTLQRVAIENNTAPFGAGIYAAGGTTTIVESTIANNIGGFAGAGVYIASGATVNAINSTISNNSFWAGSGAGFYVIGALKLTNSTVMQNRGTGIYLAGGTAIANNSIIVENYSPDTAPGTPSNIFGTFTAGSSAHNLVSGPGGAGGLTNNTNGNIVLSAHQSAELAPLGYYGGPTKTHALYGNSPAIDHGKNILAVDASNVALTVDQRGLARFVNDPNVVDGLAVGGTVDIGAYESAAPLSPQPIIVSTLADEDDGNHAPGDLSLREAIKLAEMLTNSDIIQFDNSLFTAGSRTITLTYDGSDVGAVPDQLVITRRLTIEGPGADLLTISGNNQTRVFQISNVPVTLRNSRITGGSADYGGGIWSYNATLTVDGCQIDGNSASYSFGSVDYGAGGGISLAGGALTLSNSTIANNSAGTGGAISFGFGINNSLISNSTISGNTASVAGGGIDLYGMSGQLKLVNSTVTNNVSNVGGGIHNNVNWPADVVAKDSIIAGNFMLDGATPKDVTGTLNTASTYNLFGSGGSGNIAHDPAGAGNIVLIAIQSAGLCPLGYYGGRTKTHALLATSPAVDKGNPIAAAGVGDTPVTDQRGFDRIFNGDTAPGDRLDIGATESGGVIVPKADFNGDGRDDSVMRDLVTGSLVVFLGANTGIGTGLWGHLDPALAWNSFQVGDFNGDGRDDLLARDSTNKWSLALSESTVFHVQSLNIVGAWTQMFVGDFDNDGADDLLARVGTGNWQLLEYSGEFGGRLRNDVGNPISAAGATLFAGDVNRDGRADLVGRVAGTTDTWYVGLSQLAPNGTGAFLASPTPNVWANWFNNGYYNSGTGVLDFDGPYRTLVEAYANVYNNVELDFYYGIKKGAVATLQNGTANDWDQAVALFEAVKNGPFQATITTGRVTEKVSTLREWVGAKSDAAVPALLDSLSQGPITAAGSGVDATLTFDHAWIRALVPTATGLTEVNLDPSWKFKDYQLGVSLAGITDLNLTDGYQQGLFDEFNYLADTVVKDGTSFKILPDTPLEFFEGKLQQWLTDNYPGKSLADVPYDGPLKNRVIDVLPPTPWNDTNTASVVELGTLAYIFSYAPYRTAYTHRFRLSLVGWWNSQPTWQLFTYGYDNGPDGTRTIAENGLDQIMYNAWTAGQNHYYQLFVNGVQIIPQWPPTPPSPNGIPYTVGDIALHLQMFAPGEAAPGGSQPDLTAISSTNNRVLNVGEQELVAVGINGNQQSAAHVDSINSALMGLGTGNTPYGLSVLAMAKYLNDTNQSARQIAKLTGTNLELLPGFALLHSSHEVLTIPGVDLSYTPYGMIPVRFAIGETNIHGILRDLTAVGVPDEANQLLSWQTIAHRHQIIEEVTSSEAGSAIRVLQRLFGGQTTVANFPFAAGPGVIGYFEARLGTGIYANRPEVHWFGNVVADFNTTAPNKYTGTSTVVYRSPYTVAQATPATKAADAAAIGQVLRNYGYVDGFLNYNSSTGQYNPLTAQFLTGIQFAGPSLPVFDAARVLMGPITPVTIGGWTASAEIYDTPFGIRGEVLASQAASGAFRGTQVADPFIRLLQSLFQPVDTGLGFLPTAPASVSSGNVFPRVTDIQYANLGVPLDFARQYNSRSAHDIGMSSGWSHSYSDRLLSAANNGAGSGNPIDLIWLTSDGLEHRFDYRNGAYVTPAELLGSFTKDIASSEYVFKSRDGMEVRFAYVDALGRALDNGATYQANGTDRRPWARLSRKLDLNGDGIKVVYVSDLAGSSAIPGNIDRIAEVRDIHDANRKLVFTYNPSADPDLSTYIYQVVKHVPGSSPATWTYAYQVAASKWHLTEARSPAFPAADYLYTYTYYGQSGQPTVAGINGLMRQEIMPNSDTREFAYYPNRRVYSVKDGDGFKQTYSYDLVNGRTTVRDERGNMETYLFNSNGLITRQIHADRTRIETQWGVPDTSTPISTDILAGTEFLQVRAKDEVGATELFEYYYGIADGFKDRELKKHTSKQFIKSDNTILGTPGVETTFNYSFATGATHIVKPWTITVGAGGDARTSTFTYDPAGRLLSETNPLLQKTTYEYYDNTEPLLYQRGLLKRAIAANGFDESGKGDPIQYAVLGTVAIGSSGILSVRLPEVPVAMNLDAVRIDRVGEGALVTSDLDLSLVIDDESAGFTLQSQAGGAATGVSTLLPSAIVDKGVVGQRATSVAANGPGIGDAVATWTFTDLAPGNYRVSVNLLTYSSALNYFIYEGPAGASTPLLQAAVNAGTGANYTDHSSTFTYDASGNTISTQVDALPTIATATYHHTGAMTESKSRTGTRSVSTYDLFGRRLTAAADVAGVGSVAPLTTSFQYDASGQVKKMIDPLNRTVEYVYDHRGNIVTQINPDLTKVEQKFDGAGNRVEVKDELGRITRFVYDGRNRLIQTIHPDGAVSRVRYDGVGRIVTTEDARGSDTRFAYDAAGRMTRSVQDVTGVVGGVVTVNKYNVFGDLKETIDGEGHITRFEYDALGRVKETRLLNKLDESPSAKDSPAVTPINNTPAFVSTIDYDADGNIVESIIYDVSKLGSQSTLKNGDPRGLKNTHSQFVEVTEFTYDSLDRPIETKSADGSRTRIVYDGQGQVRQAYDELNRKTVANYDGYGRTSLIAQADPNPLNGATTDVPTTTFAYDKANNLTSVTDANGYVTQNVYDAFNRLIAKTDAEGNTTSHVYDIAGQMVAAIDALGRAAYVAYDKRGRQVLSQMPDPDGVGPLRAPTTKYEYDAVGNITGITAANGQRTTYQYDELNRQVKEFTKDVHVRDNSSASDAEFTIVSGGTPATATNVDDQFGRDHTTIAGNGTVRPEAKWVFKGMPAGTYTVAISWKSDPSLDQNAELQVKVGAGSYGTTVQIDQRDSSRDEFFDHQGRPLGWKVLNVSVSVPTDGQDVEIRLYGTGIDAGTKISVDAVMLQRTIERTLSYDNNGSLKTKTDTLGRTTSFLYDEAGRIVKTTLPDPDASTSNGGPNGSNLQAPVIDYTYDGYGNVQTVIERRGSAADRTTSHTYDKRNRLTKAVSNFVDGVYNSSFVDQDVITQYEFDLAGNLQRRLDGYTSSNEVVTDYDYDDLNRLTVTTADAGGGSGSNLLPAAQHKTTYTYDRVGNVLSTSLTIPDPSDTDEASSLTTYHYDRANRLVAQVEDQGTNTNYVNATSRFAYDAAGNLVSENDPTGRITRYQYDRLDRLTKTIQPDPDAAGILTSPELTSLYDIFGNIARSTNGEGESTHSIYDTLGREIMMIDARGSETRHRYDAEGNQIAVVDPNRNLTTFTFDALNRLKTETIYSNGSPSLPLSRTLIYDDAGNLAQAISRNTTNNVREFTYDALDRLTHEQWFVNLAAANASSSLASGVPTLAWKYDSLGRVIYGDTSIPSSFAYRETTLYDNLGRVTEARNYESTEGFNPRVRQTYQYDIIDLSSPTSPFKTKYSQFKEDGDSLGNGGLGNVTTNEDGISIISADRLGRVRKIEDQAITANNDTITTQITAKAIAFSYDAAGRMTSTDRDSGTFHFDTNYTYDGIGRLSSLSQVRNSQASAFLRYDYKHDAASRITEIKTTSDVSVLALGAATPVRTESYVFDDAGQLTSRDISVTGGVEELYAYDANGNRQVSGGQVSANNRITNDGTFTYEYDNEGNLTRRITLANGATTEFVWDHRNRLTEVIEKVNPVAVATKQTSYRYNNDDLRVRKDVRSGAGLPYTDSETYVYDGNQVVMSFDQAISGVPNSTGYLKNRYLYAPGVDQLLADEDFGGRSETGNTLNDLAWAALDYEGTVRQLLDNGNNVIEHREYDAFGNITALRNQAGTLEQSGGQVDLSALDTLFGFAGREFDTDSRLYYNRARWYDARQGRFLSEDPLGLAAGDMNLYRYAGNDPVNSRDPSGLKKVSQDDAEFSPENYSHDFQLFSPVTIDVPSESDGFSFGISHFGGFGGSSGVDMAAVTYGLQVAVDARAAVTRADLVKTTSNRLGELGATTDRAPRVLPELESPLWEGTKAGFYQFFVVGIYGGAKALVTGEAGTALGNRAVGIVETQTGKPFTGTASEWGRFGRGVAGDLVGVNGVVEAGYGYDISSQQQLDAWQRGQRGAAGIAALAGNGAGALSTAARFPATFPTAARAAGIEAQAAGTAAPAPQSTAPSRFGQLREAAEFLRDEAGISDRAGRRQVIESFGDDVRVETYQGRAYQYSGSAGPVSRYPAQQSRYLSTRILDDPVQELALPTRYNSAKLLQGFEVLPTKVLRGTVAPQQFPGGPLLRGGAEQIFVPKTSTLRAGNIVLT